MLFKRKQPRLAREYAYASHHHLIPLYLLAGIAIFGVAITASFVTVLWQKTERESYLPAAQATVNAVEDLFIPTALAPAEKKQYVYPANIRLTAADPYESLRFSYDPGATDIKTSGFVTFTTESTLEKLTSPLLKRPELTSAYLPKLQQCARMYAVRFEPGLIPLGGFTLLKDVPLKDGRTAYLHKNTACVPGTTQEMTALDKIEQVVLSVESY